MPRPTQSTPTDPADPSAIFARATVALAKSQRLIATWLPPPSASDIAGAKTEEEIEREEREMFAPLPELLGVGATVPKDGDVRREELSSNDKLRRQLLGRGYKKVQGGRRKNGHGEGSVVMGSKPRPAGHTREVDQDSEDEGGRSSLGKSKRKREVEQTNEDADVSDEDISKATNTSLGASSPPKRAMNYLDQVLVEKSRRKQKKNKKRKTHNSAS